jgi:hypothetical protein
VPTFEKLDRILVSTDWEVKYPKVLVQALTRDISDHTPLLLDTRDSCTAAQNHMFKFELSWLIREDFNRIVNKYGNKKLKGTHCCRYGKTKLGVSDNTNWIKKSQDNSTTTT